MGINATLDTFLSASTSSSTDPSRLLCTADDPRLLLRQESHIEDYYYVGARFSRNNQI